MNIVLCGFMGCGKTTIGKMLSSELQMPFIDLDEYIVENQKMTIPEIFEKFGEEFFRRLETDSLKELNKLNNHIISLGGGTVLRNENIKILKQNGKILFLDINAKDVYERLKNSKTRPLLKNNNSLEKISQMLNKRLPFYQKAADFTIKVNNTSKRQTLNYILKLLNKNNLI